MLKKKLRNQKGFTLIEIIAVLVILGILAAVALPKYFDMQITAEKQTLRTALNDMKSRAATCYAKSILSSGGVYNTDDCNSMASLGFSADTDYQNAYRDFVGTWGNGTYAPKNKGENSYTFSVSGGTTTTGPVVSVAPSLTS
jgi:prepilin-type N-terminal cleavage/methylation domain-containing protein